MIFPAGAVSTSPDRLGREPAVDGPWSPFAARLVRHARARVLPVYFPGQNSRLFQLVSHVHLNLRLGLFFHEVRRRIGTRMPVEIGAPAEYAVFEGLSRGALLEELRARTYALGEPAGAQRLPARDVEPADGIV